MINWFTVVAQIVNFLILVGLLKHFLYARVLEAMEKRQQEIAARWNEAQQRRDEAEVEMTAAQEKNRQLDEQREQLLVQIREEAEQQRRQLTAKVHSEVEESRERWARAIQEETESFLRDLRHRTSKEVLEIARRVLSDLATAELEPLIVRRFLHELDRLTDREREAVIAAIEEGDRVAVVQTTYELGEQLQAEITKALQEQLLSDLDVRFEQAEDALCGIAILTDAHKLAWDVRDYLVSMEQALQRALDEETASKEPRRPTPVGGPQP